MTDSPVTSKISRPSYAYIPILIQLLEDFSKFGEKKSTFKFLQIWKNFRKFGEILHFKTQKIDFLEKILRDIFENRLEYDSTIEY